MTYNNKKFETIGEIFNEALRLAKKNKKEALEFFKAYIQYILEDADDINTLEEAEERAKHNFGYFAGYYSADVCKLIYKTFQCSHPIFGDKPFEVSPEEAFRLGQESARKHK